MLEEIVKKESDKLITFLVFFSFFSMDIREMNVVLLHADFSS